MLIHAILVFPACLPVGKLVVGVGDLRNLFPASRQQFRPVFGPAIQHYRIAVKRLDLCVLRSTKPLDLFFQIVDPQRYLGLMDELIP